MAKALKPVVKYECQWCKKLFNTDNKHECKFDPDKKNCLSCKHCTGVDKEYESFDVGFGWHQQEFHYFKCDLKPEDCDEELREHSRIGWQRNCSDWEMIDDYAGSSSYAKYIFFREQEMTPKSNVDQWKF